MQNDYSLETLAKSHEKERLSFKQDFPDIVECIDFILFMTKSYQTALLQSCSDQLSTNLIMLIPRFQSYFEQSVLLAVEGRIDESYALLRMSTEVMRDIHKLLRDEGSESDRIYSNRTSDEGKYRKRFKFRTSHGPSKLALELYSISSKFGIHGHNMTMASSMRETTKMETPFGDFVVLKMTNLGKMPAIHLWLKAVFPLYAMLLDARADGMKQPHTALLELEPLLREVIIHASNMADELKTNLETHYDIKV
ncbi:hypothetical protein BOO22_14660 [Vibrio cidicii]|uniref:hypothetical protein n=1 Tax=Vibrio cidicii TaxID=1763883 RepID=UPI0018C1E60D|nr:hypothetical protein [Vibrio cidicii]MBG0760653.1 hypothetical protein [Vibrio cidicii]